MFRDENRIKGWNKMKERTKRNWVKIVMCHYRMISHLYFNQKNRNKNSWNPNILLLCYYYCYYFHPLIVHLIYYLYVTNFYYSLSSLSLSATSNFGLFAFILIEINDADVPKLYLLFSVEVFFFFFIFHLSNTLWALSIIL